VAEVECRIAFHSCKCTKASISGAASNWFGFAISFRPQLLTRKFMKIFEPRWEFSHQRPVAEKTQALTIRRLAEIYYVRRVWRDE
jgi:hypothetical protein